MKKIRVLLVDDHEIVRRGVAVTLAAQPDLEVCGEAANGREAIQRTLELKPDIVVMDISMPEMNGLDATQHILKEAPETRVLILTLHESEELVRTVLTAGARGYLLKSDVAGNLVAALRAVAQRQLFFTSKIGDLVMRTYCSAKTPEPNLGADPLSLREREVLQLIAHGRSNKEVAAVLEVSVKTVESHRANLMSKLNLHSVADLVRYAVRNHLVESS